MKLGEFIKSFSHNNIIRLVYACKGGHKCVGPYWESVTMDWEILAQRGIFRHYINNEVLGLAGISFPSDVSGYYPQAINIVIEELADQPMLEEKPISSNEGNSEIGYSPF